MADLTSVLAKELRRLDPDAAGCDAKAVYLAAAAERWFASLVDDLPLVPRSALLMRLAGGTESDEHSCEWCAINYNHPRCPENAEELKDVCPSCGSHPEDLTRHADGCERLESCGQFGPPWLGAPWHPLPKGPLSGWLAWHRENTHE